MATTNQQLLDAYTDAELKILRGQAVTMGDRQLRLADLEQVRAERARLQGIVAREQAMARGGGSRFSQADFTGYGASNGWNCD